MKLEYDKNLLERFYKEKYSEEQAFLKHGEKREMFNRMNSQLFANRVCPDILFFGDSITESWQTDLYFRDYGVIINRGIGGETLEKGIERFEDDCIYLNPELCVFSEGINDMYALYKKYGKTAEIPFEEQEAFIAAMLDGYLKIIDKAKTNCIKLWIGSLLPLGTSDFRTTLIREINRRLKKFCADSEVLYIDYYASMCKSDGKTLINCTFGDDLHPHVVGYNIMYEVLNCMLKNYFRKG